MRVLFVFIWLKRYYTLSRNTPMMSFVDAPVSYLIMLNTLMETLINLIDLPFLISWNGNLYLCVFFNIPKWFFLVEKAYISFIIKIFVTKNSNTISPAWELTLALWFQVIIIVDFDTPYYLRDYLLYSPSKIVTYFLLRYKENKVLLRLFCI